MTVQEMSNQFDVLLSSYKRFKDFDKKEELDSIEFDEFEKSVFLTKAQEQLVVGCYNGRNALGESFEQTEQLRRYLDKLVKEANLSPIGEDVPMGVSSTSYFFLLPSDLMFIVYEGAKVSSSDCHNGQMLDGQPVTHDEYNRLKRNPFRSASGRRVLRLDPGEGILEVVSKYNITSYYIRYVSYPKPIILVNLPDGLEIKGESKEQACELHESLQERIVEMAVSMALSSKVGTSATTKDNN